MNSYYKIFAIQYSPCCTIYPCSFSSVAQLCPTLCDPMDCSQASLSITNSRSSLKLMPIESGMPSNHLILCCPLLLPPSIFIPNILYLLLPYLYIAPPFFPLFTGNHQFVLYICDLVLYFKNIFFFNMEPYKAQNCQSKPVGKE